MAPSRPRATTMLRSVSAAVQRAHFRKRLAEPPFHSQPPLSWKSVLPAMNRVRSRRRRAIAAALFDRNWLTAQGRTRRGQYCEVRSFDVGEYENGASLRSARYVSLAGGAPTQRKLNCTNVLHRVDRSGESFITIQTGTGRRRGDLTHRRERLISSPPMQLGLRKLQRGRAVHQ